MASAQICGDKAGPCTVWYGGQAATLSFQAGQMMRLDADLNNVN